jgi:hypothetical protein
MLQISFIGVTVHRERTKSIYSPLTLASFTKYNRKRRHLEAFSKRSSPNSIQQYGHYEKKRRWTVTSAAPICTTLALTRLLLHKRQGNGWTAGRSLHVRFPSSSSSRTCDGGGDGVAYLKLRQKLETLAGVRPGLSTYTRAHPVQPILFLRYACRTCAAEHSPPTVAAVAIRTMTSATGASCH